MAERKKNLPIGIENFEKIRKKDFYYVDKTDLIIDLLNSWSEVTLFTRPRRFGKSLNMSMLEAFFSQDSDKSVFDGLKISEETAFCEKFMGKYPVISLSLKSLEGGSYENAYRQMVNLMNREAAKVYRQAGDSENLLPEEKERLRLLQERNIEEADLFESLYTLSELLERHYGRKTIILIDEYDVPLAKAHEDGYYDQMVRLVRNLLHRALKTNDSMEFAVLTGCMRISKESIFTGLNNLQVFSVSDTAFSTCFGFTDDEVRSLLAYYDLSARYDVIKDWYDGYRFGKSDLYCPWDVISYCRRLCADPDHPPENYWANSSSNHVVRRFIEYSGNQGVRNEIERLVNGEEVEKRIRQELTYEDMYASIDNVWSVLFTTGYLTQTARIDAVRFRLVIPNREIQSIFREQFMDFFNENVRADSSTLETFCSALRSGNAAETEHCLNAYLRRTISIRDTYVRKSMKENFYHGILIGILGMNDGWSVSSNPETGDGYSDIVVTEDETGMAILIEIKYAQDADLGKACERALEQIEIMHYAQDLYDAGYDHILKYGIACYKKRCRVMLEE